MSEDKEVQTAVGRYLARIAAELTNVSPDEKEEILKGVESHIYEALEKRSPGAATMADLGFVLADMAAPWTYAQGQRENPPPEQSSAPASAQIQAQAVLREPRLCWYPVVGLITAFVSLVVFAMAGSTLLALVLPALAKGQQMSVEFAIILAPVAALLLALPILSTVLGLVGISKIRAMRGGLYGMPLAVIMAILFPCIVLDFFVLIASRFFFPFMLFAFLPLRILAIPLMLLLVIVLNVAIYRRVSRWANRPYAAICS